MLIEFIVENYRSFRNRAILDMNASSVRNKMDHIHIQNKHHLLKQVSLYGANASGKSNLFAALAFMKNLILTSAREQSERIDVSSFLLHTETEHRPSIFQATFLIKNYEFRGTVRDVVFRYGFEVSPEKVHREWLFARFTSQESRLFTREDSTITLGEKFREGKQVYDALGNVNEKSLFLSQINTLKGEHAPISHTVVRWFRKLRELTSLCKDNYPFITLDFIENNPAGKNLILEALSLADLDIDDFTVNKEHIPPEQIPEEIKLSLKKLEKNSLTHIAIHSLHRKYNSAGKVADDPVSFNFSRAESDGTKKFFSIIAPILIALKEGIVLLHDEIDSHLHPSLCKAILFLFNSAVNTQGAQLVCSSHNPLLMDDLRKDQIFFTEKDDKGGSELYSLHDIEGVRNDAAHPKNYLMGKYGAVPYLSSLERLIQEYIDGQ